MCVLGTLNEIPFDKQIYIFLQVWQVEIINCIIIIIMNVFALNVRCYYYTD